MTGALPLSRGWRLSGDGNGGPVSFLPGVDRLMPFADLLEMEEEDGRPFPLPAPLPEGTGLQLSREIPFGSLRCDVASLRFSCVRGRGTVLLDGREIARFSDGPLSVDLSDAARLGRSATLTLAFDQARPAGVTGTVFLRCAERAALGGVSLSCAGGRMQGWARVRGEAGAYRLAAAAQEAAKETAKEDEEAVSARPGSGPAGSPASRPMRETRRAPLGGADVSFTLTGEKEQTVSFSLPVPGGGGRALAVLSLFRITKQGRELLCDRRVCFAGAGRQPRAWLPLSPEELWENPARLAERLVSLRVPAVSLPAPPEEALSTALRRKEIGLVLPPPEPEEARDRRASGVAYLAEEPFGTMPGELARQLSGFLACPVAAAAPPLPEEEMLRAAFGNPPGEPEPLRAPLLRLLIRLRADGARRGLYSGPVAPSGALSDPALAEILRDAAAPHAAAFPLTGGWWCGSAFSCRLFLLDAAPGSRGEAALRDDEGRIFARAAWRDEEMPVITARLPDKPGRLSLSLTLLLPDGRAVPSPDLPVFVGRRGPLEAACSPERF